MDNYPERLSHTVPGWVKAGAIYHIRIRAERSFPLPLTEQPLASTLLKSARFYHDLHYWHCYLLLLMPDHLHALIRFPYGTKMTTVVGSWKSYHAKKSGMKWQPNFFDHRVRSDDELNKKTAYILRNPVIKDLCNEDEAWPFVFCGDL